MTSRSRGIVLGMLATSAALLTLQPEHVPSLDTLLATVLPDEPAEPPVAETPWERSSGIPTAVLDPITKEDSAGQPEPELRRQAPGQPEDEAQRLEAMADRATDAGRNAPDPDLGDLGASRADPHRSHRIWNPFRSELAARGFANRLYEATGVDVLVRQDGPRAYQAIFEYRNSEELQTKLALIEGITGLDLEAPDD